ncbi:DUF4890 domain-containing protein [Bacteroides sp. 224]|uniref:DUF4890 domain-containing protein n=1 Tax=Bacteroides sp. 224 TaxID=2302936 RepID=UPI0013D2A515|nr:DUF4890 domain-containing protein [Bacteroides sp. 224]NDV65130.1 DUF4890 domain-containing protein [Bacteroides sp. 224]
MKKITFLIVIALMTTATVMAQGPRRGGQGQQRERDPKAQAERMTERMAKEYSLNEEQKKQLSELNLTMTQEMSKKAEENAKKEKKNKEAKSKEVEKQREARKAQMDDYNTKLKKILTEEQYNDYIKKREERQKRMEQGGGRQQGRQPRQAQ